MSTLCAKKTMNEFDISSEINQDLICHYTSLTTTIEHILFRSKLRLNRFKNSNDPFEYNEKFFTYGFGRISNNNSVNKKAIGSNICYKLKSYIDSALFISFCQTGLSFEKDSICYLKPRMWSQYANDHSGVGLVFSKNELVKKIAENTRMDYCCGKIKYNKYDVNHDKYPSVEIPDECDFDIDQILRYYKDIFVNQMLLSKHIDYKDEDEYRLIQFDNDIDYSYLDISVMVKKIVISDRISDFGESVLRSYAEKLGSQLLLLNWSFSDVSIFDITTAST